jgi:outer membrane autotransporter protein
MDYTGVENFGVTPYIGFHYRGVDLGNFSETGAGALGVDLKTLNHDIFQPELGVTADGLYHLSPLVVLKPMVGLGVGFGDAANSILAEFQGGGAPFTVSGPQRNGAFLAPEAGLQFQIGPVYSLSLTYRGAFGQGVETEGGWITFRGVW